MKFSEKTQAAVEFELTWQNASGRHVARRLLPRADLWRDVVHPDIAAGLAGAEAGRLFETSFPPGTAVPAYDEGQAIAVPGKAVRMRPPRCDEHLRLGRFYPRGVLSGGGGFFSDDLRPFRVIGLERDWIIADSNHPLARVPLTLRARVVDVRQRGPMLGGSCVEWLEEVTLDGPGMESRWKGRATDFGGEEGLRRESEEDDVLFYAAPRLVDHVDARASAFLREEYARHLDRGCRVLDLMSSYRSHLPGDLELKVTGLGLNEEEMKANPALGDVVVHDLNREPRFPLAGNSFRAVVCSLSVEYLTRPAAVVAEVSRVLEPGGIFLVGFSNRWFPPKVTRVWTRIHEFERMGLVLEHLRGDGSFGDLRTLSVRNWPRPAEDSHYPQVRTSDPVYVVSGVKK